MTNFRRLMLVCTGLLFIALGESAGADPAGSDAGTLYEITIPDGHRTAAVSATLIPDGDRFTMFPGANQLPARWSTFVSNFEVRDSDDRLIPVTEHDDGTWQLSRVPHEPVTFSYTVSLDHEAHSWSGGVDGAAYWREWGVFYTARSLFIINGEELSNITVEFKLPEDWHVTTPWQSQGVNRFVVPGHNVLGTSMFFAGTHKEIVVRHGPFEFLLALGGEQVLAQEAVFVEMADGVLDYYVELMGDVPRLANNASAGKPVVIINQAEETDGEAIGNNISMLLGPSDDPMSQQIARMLFAHEFFHLWNGKSFRPTGEDGEWLKEGFSNYYTLKALHHAGHLNDEAFLGIFGGFFYQRYVQDDAVGRLSITNGHLKHEHWGLIYCGGMLVAIAQDLKIRAATNNAKSLDDLMRYLFDEHGETPYSIAAVEYKLSELNGVDQDEFFARYVYGVEKIPVEEFLLLAGIETVEQDGRMAFRTQEATTADNDKIRASFFGD